MSNAGMIKSLIVKHSEHLSLLGSSEDFLGSQLDIDIRNELASDTSIAFGFNINEEEGWSNGIQKASAEVVVLYSISRLKKLLTETGDNFDLNEIDNVINTNKEFLNKLSDPSFDGFDEQVRIINTITQKINELVGYDIAEDDIANLWGSNLLMATSEEFADYNIERLSWLKSNIS